MNPQLQRAIHAAKEGHHATARRMLLQVLDQEPENEVAWMWMAHTVEDRDRRRQALERVLEINPDNERAQQELAKLRSRPTPPPVEQMKKCPYCAETIKAEAVACRYCGRDLDGEAEKDSTLGFIGLALLFLGAPIWCFSPGGTPSAERLTVVIGAGLALIGTLLILHALITGNMKLFG